MEKKLSKIFYFIILLIPMILYGCKAETIITKEYKDINKLTVTYYDTSIVLNINKDEKVIKEIYDCIVNTKLKTHQNPTEMDSQLSDPLYTIKFYFDDNTQNLIYSTESGELIYRLLDKQGSWIGGKNKSLKEKIIKLFPEPDKIEKFFLKKITNNQNERYPAKIISKHEDLCSLIEIKIISNYKYFVCKNQNDKKMTLAISENIDDNLVEELERNRKYLSKKYKVIWNEVETYIPEYRNEVILPVLFDLQLLD